VHPLAILILRPHRWLDTAFEKLLHRKRRDGLCRDLTSPLSSHRSNRDPVLRTWGVVTGLIGAFQPSRQARRAPMPEFRCSGGRKVDPSGDPRTRIPILECQALSVSSVSKALCFCPLLKASAAELSCWPASSNGNTTGWPDGPMLLVSSTIRRRSTFTARCSLERPFGPLSSYSRIPTDSSRIRD